MKDVCGFHFSSGGLLKIEISIASEGKLLFPVKRVVLHECYRILREPEKDHWYCSFGLKVNFSMANTSLELNGLFKNPG